MLHSSGFSQALTPTSWILLVLIIILRFVFDDDDDDATGP